MHEGGSTRDPRIEDPSNLYVIHPIARALLPIALRAKLSANAVSIAGLICGLAAALAYSAWRDWRFASLGLLLMMAWHVFDGLDGMVARATKSASATGRLLDGLCDISTFVLVYTAIAISLAPEMGSSAYLLAALAGATHAVQSAVYEGERDRFHAFSKGETLPPWQPSGKFGIGEQLYVAFRRAHGGRPDAIGHPELYHRLATPLMQMMIPLTANARTLAIWIACVADRPALFWWWELLVLTPLCWLGVKGLRKIERSVQPGSL